MKLILKRDDDSGKRTIGRLYVEDEFICYTLENTWKNNEPRVSCIPEGTYPLTTKEYGRFYDKYQMPIPILGNTEPRSEILIHPGNYAKDTLGCILVGDSKGKNAVWRSVLTWKKFHSIITQCDSITIKNR